MTKRRILPLALCLVPFTLTLHAQIDPELLAGMKARAIGPATMSGRVAAIDAVERYRFTPATRNGEAISSNKQQRIEFKL